MNWSGQIEDLDLPASCLRDYGFVVLSRLFLIFLQKHLPSYLNSLESL